ncbi:hypothetical protein [Nonomuraea africana]|uniref:WD40 repeat protein n=1 Tax=Nonomuraea africana TaxID=46171 RepID=A0ABR9KAN5_9ACTN|nr:hypothetical protein [Nonomuraea africana]MBE1559072.1 WD40 repeat protein [Nonomuraea africana]
MLLGDPDTGIWVDRIEVAGTTDDWDDAGVRCMDVGVVGGRPVAVTGANDGIVCLWDLQERRLVGDPIIDHQGEVFAVHLTEIGDRAVALTAGRDCRMRVWDLGRR